MLELLLYKLHLGYLNQQPTLLSTWFCYLCLIYTVYFIAGMIFCFIAFFVAKKDLVRKQRVILKLQERARRRLVKMNYNFKGYNFKGYQWKA